MPKSVIIGLIVCAIAASGAAAATTAEIAEYLPKQPAGLGRPASDRKAWKALSTAPGYKNVVDRAVKLIGSPIPKQSDELFLDFSRTGNRNRWQKVAWDRRSRIGLFTVAECIENPFAHTGHDPHVCNDIGAVRNLHTNMRDVGADRSHAEWDHIHGPTTHRPVEEAGQSLAHLGRIAPMVSRTGVRFFFGTDERAIFDTRHVGGVGLHEITMRTLLSVQAFRGPGREHQLEHPVVLFLGAVAPLDLVGLRQLGNFIYPGEQAQVLRRRINRHAGLPALDGPDRDQGDGNDIAISEPCDSDTQESTVIVNVTLRAVW